MAETVLVTGGSGYIGGWSIVELLKRGYVVRTTVRDLAREAAIRSYIASVTDPGNRLAFYRAELTSDQGWETAITGCDYVWHVASPLGVTSPKDPNELIVPAREGALRVLRGALDAGVKRVVMTSSTAASNNVPLTRDSTHDETSWTDPRAKGVNAYRQSKAIAERAAWDLAAQCNATSRLTTILPTAVLGPVLTADNLGSVQIVSRLLKGALPGSPRLGFNVVDVRDVVDAHMRAMTTPLAGGERFIASGDHMWIADIAQVLRSELGDKAKRVPKGNLPNFFFRLAGLFDPALRELAPTLGRTYLYKSDKAQRVLGWSSRPVKETIVDCANSLIAKGAV